MSAVRSHAAFSWISCRPRFFLPVRVLSCLLERLFRVVNVIGFDDQRDGNVFTVRASREEKNLSLPAGRGRQIALHRRD